MFCNGIVDIEHGAGKAIHPSFPSSLRLSDSVHTNGIFEKQIEAIKQLFASFEASGIAVR